MPRVDVRTLTDPLLFRLHLVAQELLQEEEEEEEEEEEDGTEQTNWAQVVRVTRGEILRRGFSSRDLQWLGAADQEGRERVLRAFRAERDQKRRHQRN
jgi:hypothetical protein